MDPTKVTITTHPTHGELAVDLASSNVSYKPADGYTGADTFAYSVTDSSGESFFSTVIRVEHTKLILPLAKSFTVSVARNSTRTLLMPNHVADGSYPTDWDTLELVTQPNPALGKCVISGSSIKFTPKGLPGKTSFDYKVADTKGNSSNQGRVDITIT